MKKVVSCAVMRNSDAACIEGGVSGAELMRRAGEGIFSAYNWHGKTAIVCGTGNNAGDGYVLALQLVERGYSVKLFIAEEKFSVDGKYYFDKCMNKGVSYAFISFDTNFVGYDTVVDCLFGTGFNKAVNKFYADIINKINLSGAYVISVDINSGLNGDNGLGDIFVKSDLTVSIGDYKAGHFLNKAKDARKTVVNVPIGIEIIGETYSLVEPTDFADAVKARDNYGNKGNYGYVAILGGCNNYSGAVKLANMSLCALRAGCGVSKLIVSGKIADGVMPYLLESTLFTLPCYENGDMRFDADSIDEAFRGIRAAVVGMGWGKGIDNAKMLEYILYNYDFPIVIDADGLNILSENLQFLNNAKSKVVLTPHVKEMSRLCGRTIEEILSSPIEITKKFARDYGVIVLLKGPTTVVTDGITTYLVDTGCAGMSTAGSGDVLSGLIVGVLGYFNKDILLSVAYATYINGKAGEFAQQEKSDVCMLSSDTVTKIPQAVIYCKVKNNCQ